MKKPKTLGACIDLLYGLTQARLAKQREFEEQLEKLKADEKEVEEHILNSFDKASIEGAKGAVASASITRLTLPSVKDWDAVYKYIKQNDAWDLLEKRMARVAYRDRLDANEPVPGVEPFVKIDLSLRRINSK